jgi:regulatory protein
VAVAIAALRRRERTTEEMFSWLLEKGYELADVEESVATLVEIGELDDVRFAHAFAADKRELSGWGRERIEQALVERGVPPETVEAAVDEDRESELRRAIDQLGKRQIDLDDDHGRSRALGYLTRRGYSYELAYDAVRALAADGTAHS